MIKTNGKINIKKNISIQDKIRAIDFIANAFFIDGDYTPYYEEMAMVTAIMENFIEGFDLEEGETSFSAYNNDNELHELVDKFLPNTPSSDMYFGRIMSDVMSKVGDVVQYRKARMIHGTDALNALAISFSRIARFVSDIGASIQNLANLDTAPISQEDFEKGMQLIRKLADMDITRDNIVDALREAGEIKMDEATKEILDEKNRQIVSLEEYKKERESATTAE